MIKMSSLLNEENSYCEEYDVVSNQDIKEFVEFMREYKSDVNEAEYQGREVPLGKPMQGDVKKFKVYVKNPNKFIESSSGFKKKIMIANNKMYGTPISITSNTLKCNFDELEKIVLEFYNFYKK